MSEIAPLQPVAASYFFGGCDSYTDPQALGGNEYVWGMNVVNRGGIIQTRPGTRTLFCAPSFNIQGLTSFTPSGGTPHLVLACEGRIYVSAAPFTSLRQLPNIQFSPQARYVAWAVCQQTTTYSDSGDFEFLDEPKSVLVMQDGLTRAAFWDGATSRHLNPSYSGSDSTIPGLDETPLGLWMCWSNNRLWVSRRNMVFASDIGNPLKFTETQYLNEGRAFYLPEECTGIVETVDQTGIICFTENTGTFLQSSIQDRTTWLQTPEFQRAILPKTGCVAPRSIVTQYGLIWWFSSKGLTNLDAAFRQNLSSRLDLIDNEMIASKGYLSPNLSGICGGSFENYLLQSVPSGDVLNRHTWAMDQAVFEDGVRAWNSIWTGWRPIEWTKMIVDGQERCFFASKDFDGSARVWEAFLADREDNQCPITCYAQMRAHNFGNPEPKAFRYAEIYAHEILGNVSLMVAYAGLRGGFHPIGTKEIVATRGQALGSYTYSAGERLTSNRPQTRIIRTQEAVVASNLGGYGVESTLINSVDRAFSLLLVWSGRFGFTGYMMGVQPFTEPFAGECENEEEGIKVLTMDGWATDVKEVTERSPFETYAASEAVSVTNPETDETATVVRDSDSIISERAAQNRANAWAQMVANHLAGL